MQRELEYCPPGATEPRRIRVIIGDPTPVHEGDYQATLTIEGFARRYSAPFIQVDSLGAALAAAAIAPSVLHTLTEPGGRLTWCDMEELGFPLMSAPKHYWRVQLANGDETDLSVTIGHPERIGDNWSCLVVVAAYEHGASKTHRIDGDTWPQALERAAAAVPRLLEEHVQEMGGGTFQEVIAAPDE